MNDLIESLDNCVKRSAFTLKDSTEIAWSDYRRLFQNRDSWIWLQWGNAELKIDDRHLADLAAKLKPILDRFTNKETGQFGNGLFLLWGGLTTWARPTVKDFAKRLIVAAVRVGVREVAEQLYGWANDGVLRYRYNVLLEGMDIDGDLELTEGLRLTKLPASRPNLPVTLPSLSPPITVGCDAVQMSIECEMSPALYLPDGSDVPRIRHLRRETVLGSENIPLDWLDGFCKSMSLASNGHVDWFLMWMDLGALEGFTDRPLDTTHKHLSGGRIDKSKISQACLEETRRIQLVLEREDSGRELNLAIDRWVMSKKSKSVEDRLIDLRIALEALYEIGGANEKAFRVATYGAWHLGENPGDRVRIRETLRDTYDAASRVIHGDTLKHAAKDPSLVSSAQDICRKGILRRLEETKAPVWKDIILGKDE